MRDYLFLVVGLVLLIKGADYLVSGASSIARRLRVSEFIIGLTVVSFGTSLPELVIALVAGTEGNSDIIVGNAVGSNIANVFLVLGTASVIYPMTATNNTVYREIPFTLLASLVLFAQLNDHLLDGARTSALDRSDGLALIGFFIVFLYYVAQSIKSDTDTEWVGTHEEHALGRSLFEIVGGLVGLFIGGRIAVSGAVGIAQSWGMSEAFIGLTVVAIGTSLPELATSAVAAYKKNSDIAVGNVVGSNIFNIFIVMGISSIVHTVPFNTRNNLDVGVMIFATITLFIFMFVGRPSKTVQRKEGAIFLGLYVAYIVVIAFRG